MIARASTATLIAIVVAVALALSSTSQPTAAAEPVRLASLEWEPYIGPNLPEQGYVAALIRAAFAEEGLEVEFRYYPWARALHLARNGSVEGLVPEYFDASRESEFAFSDPFPGGPLVFYRRRDTAIAFAADPATEPETAFRALTEWRFGVVRGYLNTPAFDAADYLFKEEASDDATNLRKLAFGRIDLAVVDRNVAEHLMRTRYPDYPAKLEAMQPPLAELDLFIAFARTSPRMEEIRARFNAGLAALAADGRLDALRARYALSRSRLQASAPFGRPALSSRADR